MYDDDSYLAVVGLFVAAAGCDVVVCEKNALLLDGGLILDAGREEDDEPFIPDDVVVGFLATVLVAGFLTTGCLVVSLDDTAVSIKVAISLTLVVFACISGISVSGISFKPRASWHI